jgi:hypothetical protein
METTYQLELVLTEKEFFELAGSGGGRWEGAGHYQFDEDKDIWKCERLISKAERHFIGD